MAQPAPATSAAATAPAEMAEPNPNLRIPQLRFLLASKDVTVCPDRGAVQTELFEHIKAKDMAPLYQVVCAELGVPVDQALLDQMTQANQTQLKKLEDQLTDAQQNAGETEVKDATIARAEYYSRIGDKEKSLEWYQKGFEKSVGSGTKLDVIFSLIRVAFFWRDMTLIKANIDKARQLIEAGGDWDRRNRLKVYEATYLMSIRNFKRAAELFVDSLSTFNSTEFMSYKDFIRYTILCGMVALDRVEIGAKMMNSPEILEVVLQLEHMHTYMHSLYDCEYLKFFPTLAHVEMALKRDRFLNAHYRYYVREMRIRAYAQILESYKAVKLSSLAESFGVTEDFIDRELSRFVFAKRLNCVINKVAGVVETNRPDQKNAYYQGVIKQGDVLLTRVQKLSRVINV